MSAKEIVSSVIGPRSKRSAKAIVQDALDKANVKPVTADGNADIPADGNDAKPESAKVGNDAGSSVNAENGDQKTIEVTFSLDPEMVKELGSAMPKGAKPDDRQDTLMPGDGETSQEDTSRSSAREFDQDEPMAEDEAIAEDSRHSNTPIENCRAEDPMFCPYHGAQKMTSMITDEIAKVMGVDPATKGIKVSVDKSGSDFTARATFPSSLSLYDQQSVEQGIWSFMRTKGIKNNTTRPSSATSPSNPQQTESSARFSTNTLKERMPQGYTDADYDAARAKQDIGIFGEWMDDLIEDFGDPNSDIDPQDLEDLMAKQSELEDMADQLKTGGNQQTTSQFKGAKHDFEEKYHDVRGIADLPQIQTVPDAEKMRDDIASKRHNAGDWWNAKEEIGDLRRQLGLTTAGGRALPMKTIQSKYPMLFDNWDKFKTKYENLYMGSLAKILGNGRTDTGANGKFADAQKAGDLRKMKGALHTLKYATEEYADLMPAFKQAMQEHKDDLLNYAQQNGITVVPYVPKQNPNAPAPGGQTSQSQGMASTAPTFNDIMTALNGIPRGILNSVIMNGVNGGNFIEFISGSPSYVQSLIPSLSAKFPNSKFTFVPHSAATGGYDRIQID